ncbi:MAG TPA: tRNA (N6-threonylcarbamoyladenosine(37)-N6)-methyltransferase TrmO [Gammaproteobacteria bacterium]|nr:tRNA (N6-threonylcarbamoyladenosine(37)-N6)-methyltransferase TrmO [Gammaproteobacteria bacterium]
MHSFDFQPIGIIHSCYTEKFGIPRQSGLVTAAPVTLELYAPYDRPEALMELRGFSHVWVIFVFHQAMRDEWKPTVRPPRLGGNQRIGVFASRSPFRPNPIGLSAVMLEDIQCDNGHCQLRLRGGDFLDGTPVLDIKPYLPYADALPDACGGFAAQPPHNEMTVVFNELATAQCARWEQAQYPGLRSLIEQVLQADPRPAYRVGRKDKQSFGMRLYDLDVKWVVCGSRIEVTALSLKA